MFPVTISPACVRPLPCTCSTFEQVTQVGKAAGKLGRLHVFEVAKFVLYALFLH